MKRIAPTGKDLRCYDYSIFLARTIINLMLFLILIPLPFFLKTAVGQELEFQSQASGFFMVNYDTSNQGQAGLRYIPSLSLKTIDNRSIKLDAELSLNAYLTAQARSLDSIETDVRFKPYRLWTRLSSTRFETRLGLQKINFGSATLLRPLMWFDQIDPRDPLQMTDGVYGVLNRYYFQNNSNIWVWGLIGNTSQAVPSILWSPEIGGRVQFPVPRGELGASYHYRSVDLARIALPDTASENRAGIDAKWDIGIGLWFEGVINHINSDTLKQNWQRMLSVGIDYTFGIGNGLTILGEHLIFDNTSQVFGSGTRIQSTAFMLTYPLGLIDNLRGIIYYDWENNEFYRYLSWQRTLDNWVFSLAGFWNPNQPMISPGQSSKGSATGIGLQMMVIFNH